MTQYKISFATVCMNRLHHLKETLPQNLRDNEDYPNLEFVLLDYNSSDGMEEWVRNNLSEYLQSGRLTYYRTTEPEFFNRSHSRNLSFNLCTGDIFCNVDADNFTGSGFAAYLNKEFNKEKDILVNSNFHGEYLPYKDAYGRFGSWKEDFHQIGGYDESMTSYGYEDVDIYERLMMLGRKEVKITNFDFLKSISHGDAERLSQEYFSNNLDRFYIVYATGATKVLFLFKDGKFETGTMTEKEEFYKGLFTITEGDWLKGEWHESMGMLNLQFSSGESEVLWSDDEGLIYLHEKKGKKTTYFRIDDREFLEKVKNMYSLVSNVSRFRNNLFEKRNRVNPEGYGRGLVYKNFDKTPFSVSEPVKAIVSKIL